MRHENPRTIQLAEYLARIEDKTKPQMSAALASNFSDGFETVEMPFEFSSTAEVEIPARGSHVPVGLFESRIGLSGSSYCRDSAAWEALKDWEIFHAEKMTVMVSGCDVFAQISLDWRHENEEGDFTYRRNLFVRNSVRRIELGVNISKGRFGCLIKLSQDSACLVRKPATCTVTITGTQKLLVRSKPK